MHNQQAYVAEDLELQQNGMNVSSLIWARQHSMLKLQRMCMYL